MREYITNQDYLIVNNYFTEEQVKTMLSEIRLWDELNYIQPILDKMDKLGTDDTYICNFPYVDKIESPILNIISEMYQDDTILSKIGEINSEFLYDNHDQTYISFPTTDNQIMVDTKQSIVRVIDKEAYLYTHDDVGWSPSGISILYWLWEEPKSFEGGNIVLNKKEIEVKRNMLLIMSSTTKHRVTEIKGMGRIVIIQYPNSKGL